MSKPSLPFRACTAHALLAIACAIAPAAVAAESSSEVAATSTPATALEAPIQYRRVYVPADKLDTWPRDGEKLIPIEKRDFDGWIRSANDSATNEKQQATIQSAEYSGSLDKTGRLHGKGRWSIVLRGDKSTFLPLGNMSLVVRNARWHNLPQQPARIGMWGQNGNAANRFGLEVIRSGTLEFDWHIEARSADDQIDIPWLVPAANSATLTLDIPDGKQPRIEGGVVVESAFSSSENKTLDRALRRWVIAIAPSEAQSLRIESDNRKSPEPATQTVLHEEVDYHIGPRGMEMTAKWNLMVPAGQKREVAVAVPSGLQLSSIGSDAGDLAWRIVSNSSTPTDTAFISLPETGGPKQIQVTFDAWQPLVMGAPWRLPRLRAEGVFWSSAKFELTVADTHELKHLDLTDCIETNVSRLNASDESPESHSFAAYSSSAALELNLSERQTNATVRAGSSLSLADPNLNGRLVAQVSLSNGTTHKLVGSVAPGWIVEALETIPADAVSEWFIDRRGNEQRIEVQLSRAASSARSVTVVVTARLQRFNLNEPLSAETMRLVRWSDAKTSQHLLTFQSNEPYAVVPIGGLSEVSAELVDANDRSLLDLTTGGKAYNMTDASAKSGLQLALRPGQFAAHINLEATYEKETLRQDYRLAIEPVSVSIDRLLVYATCPLGDGVRWVEKTTNTPIPADRLIAKDPLRASLPKEGEVWLLRLPRPTAQSIEVNTTISTRRPVRAAVPLLYLPEATQQDARIDVRCRNHSALWLEPNHLQTRPLPPTEVSLTQPNSPPPLCAAYRYQPSDCRDAASMPTLWAAATAESKRISLVARNIDIESYVWPDGSAAHRTTYQLDRHGDADIQLTLPAETRLASASLDGHSLEITKPTDTNQPVIIRLPAQKNASKLALYLESRGPALGAGREIMAPSVLEGLPFVAGNWTVWIPEEYGATGPGISAGVPTFSWRERLFGILGRPAASTPFDPFRLADRINAAADENVREATSEGSKVGSVTTTRDPNTTSDVSPAKLVAAPRAGWRSYHESFAASGPTPLVVLHPPVITTWLVALLLASYLWGRWIRHTHPELFATALALAAGAGLLLPISYANLAAGAVIGLLLSLVFDWTRYLVSADVTVRGARLSSATAGAIVAILGVSLAALGHAETLTSKNVVRGDSPNKIYRLLVPSNEQGQATGDKYYVSDEFLRALIARSSNSSQTNHHWLLINAAYKGELTEQLGGKDVVAGHWSLTFTIETLARDTTVVLPLNRSDADWNDTAMVDGIPLPLEWRGTGHACAVQIPEPGRYSLALSCVPKTAATNGLNQIALMIPPTSGAKFEVHYPEVTSGIVVSNAFDLAPPNGATKALNGELDETSQLAIRWSHAEKVENGNSGFALSEARWLHVTPSSSELDVKYILEGGGRRPDSITLAYDERWQLLTTEKSLNAKNSAPGTDGLRVIRIPVSSQSADRQEIALRLRLAGAPALGHLRLPSIELVSATPNKRWLAISADPALECEILDPTAIESTTNEFFAKWGDADPNDPPQTVLSNYDPRSGSAVAVRPRETEPIVDESLSLAADLTSMRVNYEAKTTPGMPGIYRIDLSVPADLSINEIVVTDADRSIPVRWSHSAKNRLSVFFGQQIAKPYRLVLTGTTPIDANGKGPLPHISTLATEDATQKIRIYRNEDVHVDFEGLTSTTDPKTDVPGPPPSQWSARPVGTCYLQSGSAAARIIVRPNKPKVVGDALTVVTRENGGWWASYRCQLSVEDGELDVLRLRIPDTCTGPFDVQSTASVTTSLKSLDDQTNTLSVRFATSVAKGGGVDLRIRSPLKTSTGTLVTVPAVVIESLAGGHRYVCVPDSIDGRATTWSETNVRQAAVPTKLRTGFSIPASGKSLEVLGDPFQVASRPAMTPEASPQIRLADTRVFADERGAQRITTRLILPPHGLSDCILKLPPGQSLITVELDGRPAVIRQLEPLQWQVALGAQQLPQALEIVSRSPATSSSDGAIELVRPTLLSHGKAIPAEISLWSLAYPRQSTIRVASGADEVTALDQSALRFDRLVSIAESAKTSAGDLPSPDGYNWFQTWVKLLDIAQNDTQRIKSVPDEAQRTESQVSRTAEDQIGQAADRLTRWIEDCRRTVVSDKPQTDSLPIDAKAHSAVALSATAATEKWSYYVAEGGNDRLKLHLQPLGATSDQIRLIGLPLIAALLIASLWLMRQPAAIDAVYRWPHACGVLIGIAYWTWLWPSWLGMLIVAASLWMSMQFHWPGRALHTEASTVLRASRTS